MVLRIAVLVKGLYWTALEGLLVGVRGFEPPTTATPLRCATRLRYTPKIDIVKSDPENQWMAINSCIAWCVSANQAKDSGRDSNSRYR
jgi:hypothetical protein